MENVSLSAPQWAVYLARRMFFLGVVMASCVSQAQLDVTNDWIVPLETRSDSTPAIDGEGAIYFGAFDGKLRALKPDGTAKWTFLAGMEIVSSPALAGDGTVYFGCRDRMLYAVDAKGQKKWAFKTGAWVDSSPAIATDGTIYFGVVG